MLPRVALVDPELTYGLPPVVTANTGLDALTQLIEPYVSARANPLVDALCVEGIGRIARALRCVYRDGADREARSDMALASLLGGLALANAGLGVVHGFASVLGGGWKAPHGALVLRCYHTAWRPISPLCGRVRRDITRWNATQPSRAYLPAGRMQAQKMDLTGCARSAPSSKSPPCTPGRSARPICPA